MYEETNFLIYYSEIAGFPLSVDSGRLKVSNGSNLPEQHKKVILLHKEDIIQILEGA